MLAFEALMPVDVLGLARGGSAMACSPTSGRHPGRPDVRQPGRSSVRRGQRRLQGGRHRPYARASVGGGRGASRSPTARCWRCRGRRPKRRWRAWCRASPRCGSWMWRRSLARGRALGLALGLYRRGRVRDLGARSAAPKPLPQALLAQPEVAAHRPWRARLACGWRRGCASTAMTSTPRPRPVEAGLTWAIQKARRAGGARAGGFPGADRILRGTGPTGPTRLPRRPAPRRPRADARGHGAVPRRRTPVGAVTSGGFGPSVEAPIAMGYVPAPLAAPGTALTGEVRGKRLPVTVCRASFPTLHLQTLRTR